MMFYQHFTSSTNVHHAEQYCQFESVGARNSFFLTDIEGVAKTHDWE